MEKEILLLDDEGNELLLPKTEQIPSDFYRKGETARAVVTRVDNKTTIRKSFLAVLPLHSCSVYSNKKYPKSMTD